MTQPEIRKATVTDAPTISALAYKIWPVAYQNIISKGQIEYMLSEMYGTDALEKQMLTYKHQFLILFAEGRPGGFISYSEVSLGKWKIHKLYVLPELHGKNLGKNLLQKAEAAIYKANGTELLLNVNRNNPAVGFYKKCGFSVNQVIDIPYGPYMLNDFVMVKPVENQQVAATGETDF